MFAIVLLIVACVFYHVYQRYRMRDLAPYFDGAMPIIGHSLYVLFAKNYYSLLTETMNKSLERRTELVRLRLGIWDLHVLINPEDAYMVSNSCLQKDPFYDLPKQFLGKGLITAPVDVWKIHRKMLNPTFNQQVLDGFLLKFNSKSRDLINTVAEQVGKGPFDHSNHVANTTLQVICVTTMGGSIDAEDRLLRSLFIESLQKYFPLLTERVAKFWLLNDFIYKMSGNKKQSDILMDKMKRLSETILRKTRAQYMLNKNQINGPKSETPFKPFIEQLVELSEDGSLSDQEIFDELNTFIVAGTDTMSVTLTNALSCIGNDNVIQDRILEELKEVFEGTDRDVSKQDLFKLKYLDAVIKETLRMYPPGPIIARVVDKDIKIKGYTMPAGSRCFFGVYGIQRHWSWGPDAHQFRPERWVDGSLPNSLRGFTAFGIGRRSCIGTTYAMMFLKTAIANFLRKYSIKSDTTNMVHDFSVTAKPISGHEISIERR